MIRSLMRVYIVATVAFLAVSCTPELKDDPELSQESPAPSISGIYKASVAAKDFAGIDVPPSEALLGEWTLVLSEGGEYNLQQEAFGSTDGKLDLEEGQMTFYEAPAPRGTFNCYKNERRTTTFGEGTYSYELEEERLTLRTVEEACPLRESLLARTWQRI